MPNTSPDDLRGLADWQRRWAKIVGNELERQGRLELAAYLDRMATERERLLDAVAVDDPQLHQKALPSGSQNVRSAING
jgi:hypothetical protein